MKPVRITSFSYVRRDVDENELLERIDANVPEGTDIVILPETCTGPRRIHAAGDPFLSGISRLAARHRAYILCPVGFTGREPPRLNSALLYDRSGGIVCRYDKLYPYWPELGADPPVAAGEKVCAADTDFGRISVAICFDANFPGLWQDIADTGAELVLWVSAYSAGRQLAAHAMIHHYGIVTATGYPDFAVYDPDGEEADYRCAGGGPMISHAVYDIDRFICHYNFNKDRVKALMSEHPGVRTQRVHDREQWILLHAPEDFGIDVRGLCAAYGIESLRSYKRRSGLAIDKIRREQAKV